MAFFPDNNIGEQNSTPLHKKKKKKKKASDVGNIACIAWYTPRSHFTAIGIHSIVTHLVKDGYNMQEFMKEGRKRPAASDVFRAARSKNEK